MLTKIPGLQDSYFINSFIGGLKEEVKNVAQMFHPISLNWVISLTRLQEATKQVLSRSLAHHFRVQLIPNIIVLVIISPTNPLIQSQFRLPQLNFLILIILLPQIFPLLQFPLRNYYPSKCSVSVRKDCYTCEEP